jgi:hypothetical protein
VERHGGLDGILAALDDPASGFAPGLRAKLEAGRAYLASARDVVAVSRTVPIPPLDTKLPVGPADPDALLALAERWGLAGASKRIVDALGRP